MKSTVRLFLDFWHLLFHPSALFLFLVAGQVVAKTMESMKFFGQPMPRPGKSLCCCEAQQTVFGRPGRSHSILPIQGLHSQGSPHRCRRSSRHPQARRRPHGHNRQSRSQGFVQSRRDHLQPHRPLLHRCPHHRWCRPGRSCASCCSCPWSSGSCIEAGPTRPR